MKKFRMLEVIGDGTYGTVWKGITLDSGELVAIKKLKTKIKSWQECIDLNEVKTLSKLKSHDNIIKLKEIIREPNSEVFLIFEFAESNLYEYLSSYRKKGESIPENKIISIIKQIVTGLAYIHANGYFHRDLKPENILLVNEVVKLGDFGLAKELPSFYHNAPLTDYVCTRWYRSPECILKSVNYSSTMDVWAVGCILAELYLLTPLFPGESEFDQLNKLVSVLGTPKFNDWPDGYKLINKLGMKFPNSNGLHLTKIVKGASAEAINLMYEIFTWEPIQRPSCNKILNHPYFEKKIKDYSYPFSAFNDRFINIGAMNMNTYDLHNFNYNLYRRNYNLFPEPYLDKKSKLSHLAENEMKLNRLGNARVHQYEHEDNKLNTYRGSVYGNYHMDNNYASNGGYNYSKLYI